MKIWIFFYSETIYARIIRDKLDKKECDIKFEISNKIELRFAQSI